MEKKATVIRIEDDTIVEDEWGMQHHQAGFVLVEDEEGKHHCFINGSFNRIRERVGVGDSGVVEYCKGTNYGLWFFKKSE